jgi:hypothetical protein
MIDEIIDPSNLYLAWEKLKKALQPGDIWFDPIELAQFEANLDIEFKLIIHDISKAVYEIRPIIPVAYPKAKSKQEGILQTRQTFYISIRDQLVWIAIVNIIGPELDTKMPFWSFGNRLFRSVWYEDVDGSDKKELKIGWYRHSSGFIYRKWNQSWPRYRRDISITTRVMAHNNLFKANLEEFKKNHIADVQELAEMDQNESLPDSEQVKYWQHEYWSKQLSGDVYWAGIDLEKFYPSIELSKVEEVILQHLPKNKITPDFKRLLSKVIKFPVKFEDWNEDDLKEISWENNRNYCDILPTGLLVAGFLANVAMLNVDQKINSLLNQKKSIAHFRFVDDHIILADTFEGLIEWIDLYRTILTEEIHKLKINDTKTEPSLLKEYINSESDTSEIDKQQKKSSAKRDTKLDPDFPSPLMTQTLVKVSNINKTEFDLLDEQEEDEMIVDLEHLLLADIPDQELRKDTRISFAATMLSRIVPRKVPEITNLYFKEISKANTENRIKELKLNIEELHPDKESKKIKEEELKSQEIYLLEIQEQIENERQIIEKERQKLHRHVFLLLRKAVRENHSKVRLWTRLIEYVYNTGFGEIADILSEIEQLILKEATKLSCEFIYALIFQVLSEKVLAASKTILNNEISIFKHEAAIQFMLNISKGTFEEKVAELSDAAKKIYLVKAIEFFKIAHYASCHWIIRHSDCDKNLPHEFLETLLQVQARHSYVDAITAASERFGYDIATAFWWLIRKTENEFSAAENHFWKDALNIIPLTESTSWSIIAMYPQKIPRSIIDEIPNYPNLTEKYITNKGWLYDLSNDDKLNQEFTLYKWCNWTKDQMLVNVDKNDQSSLFDPRLSEWTALKILYQIADELDSIQGRFAISAFIEQDQNEEYYGVHPSNYIVPIEWTKNNPKNWTNWKEQIAAHKITLKEKAEFIQDYRFALSEGQLDGQYSQIIGLATLLLGLLSKDFQMPFIWNIHGQKIANLNVVAHKMRRLSISSITYSIIESCFSLRNIDTFFVVKTQNHLKSNEKFTDDTEKEIPPIRNLNDFKNRLSKAISVLEEYQISVQDNLPRQLIPINLGQYSRINNKFLEQDQNNNQEVV